MDWFKYYEHTLLYKYVRFNNDDWKEKPQWILQVQVNCYSVIRVLILRRGSLSIGPQCPYHIMQETANCGGPSNEAAKTEVLCRYRFSTISPLPAQRQYPRTRSWMLWSWRIHMYERSQAERSVIINQSMGVAAAVPVHWMNISYSS